MNYLQLCRDLILEAGYSGNMVTTENQSGQFARVVKWIRQADIDLQNEHDDWTFMDREFMFHTTVDQSRYTLEDLAALDVENVGAWDRDKMLVTDAYGRSSKLFSADFRLFHHRFETSMIQAARPNFFAVLPEGGLVLGPTPDAEYEITGWYRIAAVPLAEDEDVPLIPEPFHQAIVWKALTYYGANEEAPIAMARGEQLYREALHKMRLRYLPDVRMPGALA
jgi:hypothetical protein